MESASSSSRKVIMARVVIKMVVWVVVLGYFMMWIMLPTNKYMKKWMPNIRHKLHFTYLGSQGVNLLIFTFPVLFVAALGSVYVYLGKGQRDNTYDIKRINDLRAKLRRPMLVNGPLGIVSGIELAFLVMFVGLQGWFLGIFMRNRFNELTPLEAMEYGAKNMWEARLGLAGWTLGLVGNISLTFLFFPVARGSSLLPLLGLTSEASIKYHTWLGHMAMTIFTAHGIIFIVYWAVTDHMSEAVKWAKAGVANLAGELALVLGLVMWATTYTRIRRKMFELFFYTHQLYILFVVFFVLHVGINFASIMLPGFYLFLLDRFLRFLQSRRRVRLVSARILPCETLELNFSKSLGLRYNPTSVLFINVPSVSKLQWHPFSVTSSSNLDPDKLSIVVKGGGSWTRKLYRLVSSSPSALDRIEVAVEGPYGPASTDHFLRHDSLVMVSGGSGITPLISIIRELIFTSTSLNRRTPPILLICAFKNSSDLAMLELLLPMDGTQSDLSSLNIEIEAYVTREKSKPTYNDNFDQSKQLVMIKTRWFRPHANDVPIFPILGPNSWLYLGLIIASSFVIFLVIVGIITRHYIYPRDHDTEREFSYSIRALLNMLAICVSIAVAASAAVLWNKRANAKDTNQILNLEESTPTRSPSPLILSGERELESLPRESLLQSVNVHYGERPNLKKILFECSGSSVGVLACGPRKLRHEVARICGCGLADNLHFQSISFSW